MSEILDASGAITRFKENEERTDVFVNEHGFYTSRNGEQVETLPSFIQRKDAEIDAILASLPISSGAFEEQIATNGQTVFTLTAFTYTPGQNQIGVYINGARQFSDAFSETSSTQVTFSSGLDAGDKVRFEIVKVESAVSAGTALYTAPFTNAVQRTIKKKFSETVSVTDFGGDVDSDITSAILNAYAAVPNGWRIILPAGNFYTSSQTQFGGNKRIALVGAGARQTSLIYAGANTSNDCFVFGDDSSELNGWRIEGINFASNTLMTGGAGVRFNRISRSRLFDVLFGHQDGNGNFYHGVWFNGADLVSVSEFQCRAQQDGLRVNGGTGRPKADLFLNDGKIAQCMVGVHIGGDFGGFYCDGTDIINNAKNVLIDKGIVNVNNREVFFGPGALIDTADTTRTATQYDGIGIDVQDSGGFLNLSGTWNATAGTLLRTGSAFTGEIQIDGGAWFNAFTSYGGNGKAIEIGNTGAIVEIDGVKFKNIQSTTGAIDCTAGVTNNVFLRNARFASDVVKERNNIGPNATVTSHISTNASVFAKFFAGNDSPIASGVDGSPAQTFAQGPGWLGGATHLAYFKNDSAGPWLDLGKSRSANINTHSVVQSGDMIGGVNFAGSDGSIFRNAAQIKVFATGSPASNNVPGQMNFLTSASNTPIDRFIIESGGHLRPASDNAYQFGNSLFRVASLWSANGTVQTSDKREKIDIANSALGLNFIEKLNPVSYRWKVGGYEVVRQIYRDPEGNEVASNWCRWRDASGKIVEVKPGQLIKDGYKKEVAQPCEIVTAEKPGNRTHWGLLAQEVKAVCDEFNVDFGGWVLTDSNNPESRQALRYDQFISPLIKAVQELSAELKTVKAELKAIKG